MNNIVYLIFGTVHIAWSMFGGGGNQNQDWNRKIIPYLLEMAKKLYICTVLHLQFWIFKKKRKYKEIIAVISVEQDV